MIQIETIIHFLEMIGSAAFAVSGVMVAKESHMDLFGAIILGCITAVGGGVIRDLLLGITPPLMFENPRYVLCAFIVSFLTFWIEWRQNHYLMQHKSITHKILTVTDTIGLAVFAITGCQTAILNGFGDNQFLCIFVGSVTGIGGGIMRDMLAGQMPFIMRERIYGVASVLGAVMYVCTREFVSDYTAMALSASFTILVRYLSVMYKWNLPRLEEKRNNS